MFAAARQTIAHFILAVGLFLSATGGLMENVETFIERHNIEHYRKLLITETDPSKRAILLELLAELEAKQVNSLGTAA